MIQVQCNCRHFRVSLQTHCKRIANSLLLLHVCLLLSWTSIKALVAVVAVAAVAKAATQRMFITCRGTNWRK